MSAASKYRRLPGRSGLFARNSLWLHDDHILRVRRYPYSEEYRRYYFTDIQAIVLTELPETRAYYGYAIAAALLLLAGALAVRFDYFLAVVCATPAIPVLWISLRLRNCACYLKTMVSTDELPSLRKRKAARKAIETLKSEIQRAQGEISAEVLEEHRAGLGPARPPVKPEVAHNSGLIHWMLFGLVVVRGVVAAIITAGQFYQVAVSLASGTISAVVLLLALIAAVQQHRTDMARTVRRLVYAVLSWYVVRTIAEFVLTIVLAVSLAKTRQGVDNLMEQPAMRILHFVDVAIFLLIGCAGLILLWRHLGSTRTPPPIAPAATPAPTPENEGIAAG